MIILGTLFLSLCSDINLSTILHEHLATWVYEIMLWPPEITKFLSSGSYFEIKSI